MAYTSVIPVHRLDRSIEYVKDKEKTTQKADSLEAAIDYAMNRTKTEQAVFEDTIGCTNENAYADMVATKKRFHKMGGVEGYHLVQSFAEGEVTPELAHLIGQELADRLLKGQYEVVITTHLNTRHYHNHIVWNSVSMADGRKYHSNAKSYYTEIRKISDELCRKYGLSIIESDQKKSIPYVQWKAEQEGKPTWRSAIRLDIRESVQESYSWSQFLKEMEKRGYTWKLNRKYIALKAPGMERYIRLRSLGKNYSEEEIRGQILQPKVKRIYQKPVQIPPKKKPTGIQALYYSYLYQMGVLSKRPRRSPYAVREDIRKLDQRIEQIEFLMKHDITTREQLAVKQYAIYKQAAGKTAKSILISVGVRLAAFNLKQIANLTCTDELDLYSIGEKKVALFCCIPDADTSMNYLVGMIYSNLFQTLYYVADRKYGGRLPIPVHCIMDEWPNVALPDDFDKILATMRSRGISCSIIIQNIAQMKALFKDSYESLIGNCDEFLYLGGNEKEGHKYVSELLGKETLDTNTYGQTKGRSGSYSVNYQQTGRELLTPDEIRLLDNRKAILFIRGERPIMDDKYDLKKHVNFRYTEDGGASPYDYAKTPLAHDDLKIDINRLDDYELLSTEDILGE